MKRQYNMNGNECNSIVKEHSEEQHENKYKVKQNKYTNRINLQNIKLKCLKMSFNQITPRRQGSCSRPGDV